MATTNEKLKAEQKRKEAERKRKQKERAGKSSKSRTTMAAEARKKAASKNKGTTERIRQSQNRKGASKTTTERRMINNKRAGRDAGRDVAAANVSKPANARERKKLSKQAKTNDERLADEFNRETYNRRSRAKQSYEDDKSFQARKKSRAGFGSDIAKRNVDYRGGEFAHTRAVREGDNARKKKKR